MENLTIKYPNINSKLKGMYSKRITKTDLEDLIKASYDKIVLVYGEQPAKRDLTLYKKASRLNRQHGHQPRFNFKWQDRTVFSVWSFLFIRLSLKEEEWNF